MSERKDHMAALVRTKAGKRWTQTDIERATRRSFSFLRQAREMVSDPMPDRRLARNLCCPCFYGDRREIAATAPVTCASCGNITLGTKICINCAQDMGLCSSCGGLISAELPGDELPAPEAPAGD